MTATLHQLIPSLSCPQVCRGGNVAHQSHPHTSTSLLRVDSSGKTGLAVSAVIATRQFSSASSVLVFCFRLIIWACAPNPELYFRFGGFKSCRKKRNVRKGEKYKSSKIYLIRRSFTIKERLPKFFLAVGLFRLLGPEPPIICGSSNYSPRARMHSENVRWMG